MRKTVLLLLGAMLAALIAASGVALAANIQCPNDPRNVGGGTCWGTDGDDVLIGTGKSDTISGFGGDDLVRAGRGADLITNGESDYRFGEDENHGGRGADHVVGNLDSEKHFGGRGDDLLVDYKSGKNPDVFRCGPGRDEVTYNEGLDLAAEDCEVLRPVN
jgi:RTX calcium-binding nonapeptide repeat (4 copies)